MISSARNTNTRWRYNDVHHSAADRRIVTDLRRVLLPARHDASTDCWSDNAVKKRNRHELIFFE